MGVLSFEDLTELEAELVRAVYDYRVFDLSPDPASVAADEPDFEQWGPDRTVRAELVCQLLMGEGPVAPGSDAMLLRAVRIRGARIVGPLDLEGALVVSRLDLRGCWLDCSTAPVFEAADLPTLRLRGCWLPAGLVADQLRTRSDVDLSNSRVFGEVRLLGARIGGQLNLTGARLRNLNGYALSADRAQIDGSVFGRAGFEADGQVRLPGARIGNELDLTGAKLRNPGGVALFTDGAQIDGGMHLAEGFEADGQVRLLGARIGVLLDLTRARLCDPDGYALSADGTQIDGNMFGEAGFEADGEVRLPGAKISGTLDLTGAVLRNPNGVALNAERFRVGGTLFWKPSIVVGDVDLGFADVAVWVDAKEALAFPAMLEGLHYDAIHPGPPELPVSVRLEWLARDPGGYSPLPYTQLASVLRSGGHDRDARHVLIASQKARRSQEGRSRFTRTARTVLSAALRWTVGYGYRPWLALVWLVALIGAAALVIRLLPGGPNDSFTATVGAPRPFNTVLYVVDAVLPFVDLGYDRWIPGGAAQIITVSIVVLGWTLATAVVAAFAGILRRGD